MNDLENTFRNLWQEHKFIGNPFRWTAKERKFCKEILKAEGPEAVVTLFRYIFENWNDVKERYDLGGAPSMQLMYAYRRTFMFDALLGAPQKRKHGGDYSGDADMGESGWGDD
ncbi:MAG: hypothetical protein GWN17_05070 [Candidatus Korarchaeota archaeon]|nr:hypothetical protein [Candidatus Korarchaeota archaeon]